MVAAPCEVLLGQPEIEVVAEKFLEEVELEKLERAKVGRCTSLIQLTHSLKAPGFNP